MCAFQMEMNPLASELFTAIVVFVSTNIDDLFLLAAFFADPRVRYRSIVIGQYAGIGVLVVFSALVALLALAFPEGWVALLGIVPLYLGFSRLLALRTTKESEKNNHDERLVLNRHKGAEQGLRYQVLAVASVTVANGGDNLGVYVPLFASNPDALIPYSLTFAIMTGIWCASGFLLVHNRILGKAIKRYGHILLPVVLIALGSHILSGARTLFH